VTIYGVRRRVACYVTRGSARDLELLVLDSAARDVSTPSDVQVPAGAMLPFESIDAAARRQIEEETGLVDLTFEGQLGAVELGLHEPGGPSVTTYVHVRAPGGGEQSWRHTVSGEGVDSGTTFAVRWEPLPLRFELVAGHAAYLDSITL
jgi:8-oxo-dGTP pyrophosphatase MutT (NUDIX family)